jgi:acyl carrier protein
LPEVADRVRRFIIDDLGWGGRPAHLTAELALIDEQVVDSLGILTLVGFLESEYGIEVADREITPAHLGTLAGIERYVLWKRG